MNDLLKELIDASADYLVRDNGFKRRARTFTREDALLRKVTYTPIRTARPNAQRFDIALDLGIPGLSSLQAGNELWFVRASVSKLYRMANPKRAQFELDDTDRGREVAEQAAETLRFACANFLLAVTTPDELFDLTHNQTQRFRDLDLWPWNELPRLELAGVMAAYLARTADVQQIDFRIRAYAEANGMLDQVPEIVSKIELAGKVGLEEPRRGE